MSESGYQLQLLKVPVTDVEASSQFYVSELGCELQFAAAEYGWAHMSAGDVTLALYVPGMGGGDGKIGGSLDFHLSLPGSQFDELAQRLLKDGHLSENMIHTGNDGSTFVNVIDPDGNVIKIMKR
jgi:catechol 2,3-dioxygenase-like lactoylglutathione lyase family enzyme